MAEHRSPALVREHQDARHGLLHARTRPHPGPHALRARFGLLAAALPAAAQGATALVVDGEARGLFQADLAALVVAVALGAFVVRPRPLHAVAALAGAVLVAGTHVALRGGAEGALDLLALAAGVASGAAGLAALGRRLGAPALSAGAFAAGALWVAMSGLFWADAVAARIPERERHPFRQAVLHADPATACAYDVAGLDRMHEPEVYARYEIASLLMQRPQALPTAALWLAVGAAALGAAACVPRPARAGP